MTRVRGAWGGGAGLGYLAGELSALEAAGLLRGRASPPKGAIDLCSNDYLGFVTSLESELEHATRIGAGASRLVAGDHAAHRTLELTAAAWVGAEDALAFSSGYAANVGALSALAGRGDHVISDRLNHASIIDGARLSRARVTVVPHLDVAAVKRALAEPTAGRRFVVTESYFSMDGDIPDLGALRRACDEHDAALLVDEAHALGVFGPEGGGLCAEAGVAPDVLVGTLGKALGVQGAFVAGSHELVLWLWNRARSFVFSTGLSPLLAAFAASRIERARGAEGGRVRLHRIAERLRAELRRLGRPVTSERGPILPVVCGATGEAVRLAAQLLAEGVAVHPIRPPTVPAGTSRLRFTARASMTDDEIDRVVRAWERVLA